ncbi:aspartate dehydrogenase domain-containing protein [Pseudotabrizicola formosa]|uniref:aspartate dehydrogenase domain-containing protein n=1 Tax=Pseudotabrizicola formosa TaxID=2030009 RepID=UPI000CD0BD90|nr:aspartate dehydrogenase domain-containing protein [Pseudotabrizicola formosa]
MTKGGPLPQGRAGRLPPEDLTAVNLIGRGKIGAGVADWLAARAGYVVTQVGRDGHAPPAPLTIDTAGPCALRDFGEALLAQGDLWTVGASALIDHRLHDRLRAVATDHGTELRLFTGWITGPNLCPPGTGARLHIEQSAPDLGPAPGLLFEGPLATAALHFPDHLNTATAAALGGPGIDATSIALHSTESGGPHVIRARFDMEGQSITSETRFGTGPHPVTMAIIAALQARGRWLRYG